jgi:hypothetical protein
MPLRGAGKTKPIKANFKFQQARQSRDRKMPVSGDPSQSQWVKRLIFPMDVVFCRERGSVAHLSL